MEMQDLYAALQKADAAGDTASAKQLADYIRSLDGKPRPTPGRMDTFVNALPKGAAGFADSIINTPENVMNLGKMAFGTAATAVGRPDLAPDVKAPPARIDAMGRQAGIIRNSAEPTDAAGRIIDMVGQTFGGGGINPVQAVRNVAGARLLPLARDVSAATFSGTGAGIGSEYADNFKTGNESADTAIKAGLTFLGGAAPSTLIASRGTAGDRAAAALSGVTPKQMELAQALMDKAGKNGTPITAYEAIQAVTGINPKMQTQQRVTEQSDAAGKRLTPMMQARPDANAAMFGKVADTVAPMERHPDMLAGQLQKTAQDAIKAAQEARSQAANPMYRAQRNSDAEAMQAQEVIPQLEGAVTDRLKSRDGAVNISGQLQGLQNDMTQAAKDFHPVAGMPGFPARYVPHTAVAKQAGEGAGEATAVARQRLAEARAAETKLNAAADLLAQKNLPEIRQKVGALLSELDHQIKVLGPTVEGLHLRALRDEIAPKGVPIVYPSQLESVYRNNRNKLETGPFTTSEDRTRAGILGPQVQSLKSLINEVSPSIAEGRQKYADASRDVVDPLKLGQVGKLARSDDFRQQVGTLLPEAPLDVTPSVVKRTADTLGAQDPNILARTLAQYLRGTFNEANQSNTGGQNVFGGAKFAAKVAGNPTQEQNLVQAVKSSGARPDPLQDALAIFRAQGMKPPVNSATTANAAEAAKMGGMVSLLTRPITAVPHMVDNWRNGWATKTLAEVLSDPAGLKLIRELARENGTYSPAQQQLMVNLLNANRAN